jgi:hypothetical protein
MPDPTFDEPVARETSQLALILLLNSMTYETFLNLREPGQLLLASSGQMDEAQLKIAMRQIHGMLAVRLAQYQLAIAKKTN